MKLMAPCSLLAVVLVASPAGAAKLEDETLSAWKGYRELTEARIERELGDTSRFLVRDFLDPAEAASVASAVRSGDVFVRKLRTRNEEGDDIDIPNGLVHHWYGSVLVPNATLEDVLTLVQSYDRHQDFFEEVEESRLVEKRGDVFEIFLRLRRQKVITVHYNTDHVVTYRRLGPKRAASSSSATRISEIDQPGTRNEREKPEGDDRGYLWRLNSYWRFQEEPEGVLVELESISLSRTVPLALRWMVQPFINSVPRESVEAALRPLRAMLGRAEPVAP